MRQINEIIIHCSATRANWREGQKTSTKVAEIKRWHVKDNGWSDIGYHFLIDRDGTVAKGRPVTRSGAHTKGHNKDTIGVCLIGGHGSSETDSFEDHFTPAQEKALRQKLKDMRSIYGPVKISGHNQYAAKACPGFSVPLWLNEIANLEATVIPNVDTPKRPQGGFMAALITAFAAIFRK